MRKWIARISLSLVALMSQSHFVVGQSGRLSGGVVSQKEFKFYWETRLEPRTPTMAAGFSSVTTNDPNSPNTIARVVWDASRKIYLGYEVEVQVLPEAGTYRLVLRQLHLDRQFLRDVFGGGDESNDWKLLQTPGWQQTAPQTIRSGDIVALDLLTSRSTSQKIVDYVTVQEPGNPAPQNLGEEISIPPCPGPSDLRSFARVNGGMGLRTLAKYLQMGLQQNPTTRDLLNLDKCKPWKRGVQPR